MGQCFGEKPPPPQTDKNTFKVLCLGVGGCGKTTFIKQMKIIHHVPWDAIELENYTKIIRANFIAGMQDCIQLIQHQGIEFSKSSSKTASMVMELRPRKVDLIAQEEVRSLLLKMWKDPNVQELITEHQEQLQVSHLDYFYNIMEEVCDSEYKPTDEHILRCRQRTTGAYHTSIFLKKNYFEFHDVGGQRPERSKWDLVLRDHHYTAILYFVALDEFDTHSIIEKKDDSDDTKMEISRMIWTELINSDSIPTNTLVFLFLNKRDLFEARINTNAGFDSFKKTFPKYRGTASAIECMEYIKSIFMDEVKSPHRVALIQYTCNLDSNTMETVWNSLYTKVLQITLAESGLMSSHEILH